MKLTLLFLIALVAFVPLTQASVQENLIPELNHIEKDFNFAKYQMFLPITAEVSVLDKNETFFVKINKAGNFEFLDDTKEDGKVDVTIKGNEESLNKVLNSNRQNFGETVEGIIVYGNSITGKISLIVAGMISSVKFNKN